MRRIAAAACVAVALLAAGCGDQEGEHDASGRTTPATVQAIKALGGWRAPLPPRPPSGRGEVRGSGAQRGVGYSDDPIATIANFSAVGAALGTSLALILGHRGDPLGLWIGAGTALGFAVGLLATLLDQLTSLR